MSDERRGDFYHVFRWKCFDAPRIFAAQRSQHGYVSNRHSVDSRFDFFDEFRDIHCSRAEEWVRSLSFSVQKYSRPYVLSPGSGTSSGDQDLKF